MIFIAVGANLPGPDGAAPLETCVQAAAAVGGIEGLRLVGASRWFETAPVPPSGQPPYVNGVLQLAGATSPEALLAALQRIEREFGRVRGAPNAARTLDLDIVAMGCEVRAAPDPVLPHPRMHQRAFVLAPMLELSPGWRHPVFGLTVRAMLAALPAPGAFALAAMPSNS